MNRPWHSHIFPGLFFAVVLAVPGIAQAITWDGGGGDRLWSNSANWSGDTLPLSGDAIVIPSGAGEVVLDIDFVLTGTISVQGAGSSLRVHQNATLVLDASSLPAASASIAAQSASIVNDGAIRGVNVSPTSGVPLPSIRVQNPGTFSNNGTLDDLAVGLGSGGIFANNGSLNTGRISILTGTVRNAGLIDDATLDLQFATIDNEATGTINMTPRLSPTRFLNSSVFNNHGIVTNSATVTNESAFNNFGAFDNAGTFRNQCDIARGTAGRFVNGGVFTGSPIVEDCRGVWDNDAGNGLWSDPRNWNGDTLPLPGDDVAINTPSGSDVAVTVDLNVTIEGLLFLGNSSGPPVSATLLVPGGKTLTNNGRISAGSGTTIVNMGTIANNGEFGLACDAVFDNAGVVTGNLVARCATWDGGGGDGLWSTPANWTDERLPQPVDRIIIPAASGQVLVDVDVSIDGGVLIVQGPGTVVRVNQGVTVTLDASSLPAIRNNVIMEMNPGASLVNGGVIAGTSGPRVFVDISSVTNNGTVDHVSIHLIRGTLVNNATISSGRLSTLSGALSNHGSIDDVALDLQFATVDNQAAATIRITPAFSASRFLNSTVFNNYGTVTSLALITNESTVNNFGTFDTSDGTFENNGTFNAACGSVLLGTVSGNPPVEPVCDTTPPVVTVPADMTVEASSSAGRSVSYNVTAQDDKDGAIAPLCTPASGSTFALGPTTVNCGATDQAGNTGSAAFDVDVVDTTPPALTPPANVTAEATAVLTGVNIGSATATDFFPASMTNDAPAAGFLLGTTLVTWTAADTSGNVATATQQVTVVDTTSPLLTAPSDVTAEANAVVSTVVIGTAAASDLFLASVTNNAPAAFPLGTTVVLWTATDTSGNSGTAMQRVTVVDTTAPVLAVPPDVTVTAQGARTPVHLGAASATDIFGPVSLSNDAPPDGFPAGTTVVRWTAIDANGNTTHASQRVSVVYEFGGFLPPIAPGGVYKAGRTLPVKILALLANGALVPDLLATLGLQLISGGVPVGEPLDIVSTSSADTGSMFRLSGDSYIFNLSTEALLPGTYRLFVDLHDGSSSRFIDIGLK